MKKEFKNIIKKVSKLMFAMTLFLSFINGISAKDYSDERSGDVLKNCKNPSECTPICIYEFSDEDKNSLRDEVTNQNDVAYVGFLPQTNGWDITTIGLSDEIYIFKDTSGMPEKSIYWESYAGWQGHEGYNDLIKNFKCPKYFYRDVNFYVELCFANRTDECSKHEKKLDISTKFGYHSNLSYSFAEEAEKVLLDTSTQLVLFDSKVIEQIQNHTGIYGNAPQFSTEESRNNAIEKIKRDNIDFLSKYDNQIKYDASLSVEENINNNCKYIEENVKDIETYKNRILTAEKFNDYNNNILKKQIETSANKIGVKYPDIYKDYSLLEKLISVEEKDKNTKKIKKTERIHGYNSIQSILPNNLSSAIEILVTNCNTNNGTNIEYDEDAFRDSVTEVYSYVTREDPVIDFDKEFDCSSIFTPELVDLIRKAYFVIEIISIIILIALSSIDYAKVIMSGEQEEMKKNNQKLIKRLIIVVIIFLLPSLINLVFRMIHIEGFNSEHPLCVEIKNR